MKCTACGNENKPHARYCAYCGAEVDDQPRTLQPGQLVDGGNYRIVRALGKGGMGAVYLAANTKAFDRQCVVKEVIEYYDPTDAEARRKAVQRFEIEARTLASLKHPGIPDIYAYFSEEGRNYLVMEFIEGRDLSRGLTREKEGVLIQGHPQAAEDVIQYAIQICEVLTYLEEHQPPVMHNDIKPANIILDKNTGRATLVDFGTARTRYTRVGAGQPGQRKSSVYGTVGYAAPELYEGQAEPRSDVYALAVTAYDLLTDDDPRAHPFRFPKMDTIPEQLRQVLVEALENEAAKRPSAAQLRERLEDVLRTMRPEKETAALVPPLTFPQGQEAVTRQELIALCVRNWEYAVDILYDGSIARWLRDALHDLAATRAAEAAVTEFAGNEDAGLEHFVRALDPGAMPKPNLQIVSGPLRYGTGRDASSEIKIANTGAGQLYGTATASEEWIEVDRRVRCASGQTQVLPVAIDTSSLVPGRVYRAKVDIRASGSQSASIAVEVRVPPPQVKITPMQIDLGTLEPSQLLTERASFSVQNSGASRAVCRIEGKPPWLVVDPVRFTCLPGKTQVIEMVGRVDLLPPEGDKHGATLQIEIKGRHPRQVQVTVRTKRGQVRGSSRLGSTVMIGCATVILLAAIVWFVLQVLPMLVP